VTGALEPGDPPGRLGAPPGPQDPGGAVVFFFVAAAVGGPVAGQLTRTSRDFQDPDSESAAARDRIEAATGSEPGYGVVALVGPAATSATTAPRRPSCATSRRRCAATAASSGR
jgi:hypothetical protein